jgi:hypothetical protein
MLNKEFPGPYGLNVGEMAEELAEYDLFRMPLIEILALAGSTEAPVAAAMDGAAGKLRDRWLKLAQEQPERVEQAYKDMLGEHYAV